MAGAMLKKVNKICQIVQLKQVMKRWKKISHRPLNDPEHPPSGCFSVLVGYEQQPFAVPVLFLNLPVFDGLLKVTEEEFGLRGKNYVAFACDVSFFSYILKCLHKDEHKYGKLSLEQFATMFADAVAAKSDSCKGQDVNALTTTLLQKA
ncbi:protein SMALL AUXIN UP-REGULATED RNA 12-like [Lotus japonicus]|uniref:protein SMALL AUXIN UP-REGULATED RNA 12-like n=1 Tax=Lotus japonicus TaxID=34305 RepID=UPI0025892D6C|nr:protein SMALL AUXIN UP-REGULATED RNA 12-like [Lotus japonicus]